MKVSYNWLNEYFKGKAPKIEKTVDLLDMHSMEVEGVEVVGNDFVLDAKATPNLNHSCLCHRGMARELATIAEMKPERYSREFKDIKVSKTSKSLSVEIEDPKLCRRYIGRMVENIKVGPSPEWLRTKLETLGQRSINNIVDSTNFVMLEIGQPMHAFDADLIGSNKILVRNAKAGEKMTTLDRKEVELDESILLITDDKNPLAIAGIKGGNYAELDSNTKNIVLESANFNPVLIRKTAQKIRIQTDASKRYENDLTPELCGEAMDILTKLIVETAGTKDTKVGEVVDNYPRKASKYKLGISATEASDIIGIKISDKDIERIFDRFGFEWKKIKPIDEVLKLALTFIGVPYKNGASILYDAPKLFDCSSFVSYVFVQVGVQIPRMSVDQYAWGKKIGEKDLKAGDVVFSNTGEGKIFFKTVEFLPGTEVKEGVDHCGIYLGDGKVIHCTELKGGVAIEDMKSSKRFEHIVGYRRMSDNEERFVVTAPDERLDLRIKEDLAEEIGRIYGYDKLKDTDIPNDSKKPKTDKVFAYKEKIRNIMYAEGFSEVMNYTFVEKGEIELAKPMSPERKFLRTNLTDSIKKSLEFNARYSELIDMPQIRIFEFGHVFTKGGEKENFIIGVGNPVGVKKPKEKETLDAVLGKLSIFKLNKVNKDENIVEFDLGEMIKGLPEVSSYDIPENEEKDIKFKKISQYPYMIRDIAVFTPEKVKAEDVLKIILKEATELMIKHRLFDVFTKTFEDGTKKTSYAYRMVFQSNERTLSDDEVNGIVERMTKKMNDNAGWQVR
ncbi:MAG: phenylalanine--tRNA ligase beta subunit-related protein [Candidatus Paceibacterota bacterium]|jgi:phenylalanyl-tRNA synthetase beta subunit